jgi:two-component system cell cycle response regulator
MDATARKILVVEDSPTQAMILGRMVELCGFSAVAASDGATALAKVTSERPALVMTDIIMPGMDGYELCTRIKSGAESARTPVILLTGLTDTREVLNALACGADDFMTKPVDQEVLSERVQRALDNAGKQSASGGDADLHLAGERFAVQPDPGRVANLLFSTYDDAVRKNRALDRANGELRGSVEIIRRMQEDYRAILENNADAIVVTGPDGMARYANPAAMRMFDRTREELFGRPFDVTLTPGESRELEITRKTGDMVVAEMRVEKTLWEGNPAVLATLRDVTETVRLRDELKSMAFADALTGLQNRRGFFHLVEFQVQAAMRTGHRMLVFYIDLDGMKRVNDELGHQVGDRLLLDAAAILRQTFRRADVVARLGGDEFAVLAADVPNGTEPVLRARLEEKRQAHNATERRPYTVEFSVGVVTFDPQAPVGVDDLIKQADAAMYEHKRQRKAARAGG